MIKQNLSFWMLFKSIEVSEKQQNAKVGSCYMAVVIRKGHVWACTCGQAYMLQWETVGVHSSWPWNPREWVLVMVKFQSKVHFGSYELSAWPQVEMIICQQWKGECV